MASLCGSLIWNMVPVAVAGPRLGPRYDDTLRTIKTIESCLSFVAFKLKIIYYIIIRREVSKNETLSPESPHGCAFQTLMREV